MNFEKSVEDRHKIAAVLKVLWLFTTLSEFSKLRGLALPIKLGFGLLRLRLEFSVQVAASCGKLLVRVDHHGDDTAADLPTLCWVTTQILEHSLSISSFTTGPKDREMQLSSL